MADKKISENSRTLATNKDFSVTDDRHDFKTTLLCVMGPAGRWPRKLDGLVQVIKSWDADLIAMIIGVAGCGTAVTVIEETFGSALARVIVRRDVSVDDLKRKSLAANNRSLELFAAYRRMGFHCLDALVPEDWAEKAPRIGHVTSYYGVPPSTTAPWMLHDLHQCGVELEAYEAERGHSYEYFGFVRPDLHWFAAPPPITLLRKASPLAIWIPQGVATDWDGFFDGAALVPREAAWKYFGRWRALVCGSLRSLFRERLVGPMNQFVRRELLPEWLLMTMLEAYGARVARFAAVAAVVFQEDRKTEQLNHPFRKILNSGIVAKNAGEVAMARMNACLLTRGLGCLADLWPSDDHYAPWAWRVGEQAAIDPPCFDDAGKMMCNFGSGVSDIQDSDTFNPAWDSLYTYSRCCNISHVDPQGVWVVPSSKVAQMAWSNNIGQLCYPVYETSARMCINIASLAETHIR